MENSILNLSPEEFESAIEELGLTPEDQEFLREEYKSNNSVSGNIEQAFQPEQGQERSTFLPMTKPEGVSSMDALLSGQANLALPGAITEGIQGVLEGVEAPGWAASGLEGQATTEDAWKTASVAAGGGATATVPDGSLRMFGGPNAKNFPTKNATQAMKNDLKGVSKDISWEDTGVEYLEDGRPVFQINPKEAKFKHSPEKIKTQLESFFQKRPNDKTASVPISNLFTFDNLYDNYPDLKDVRVVFTKDANVWGQFDAEKRSLVLNYELANNPEEMRSVILHELQHGIQAIEGSSGGASSKYFLDFNKDTGEWRSPSKDPSLSPMAKHLNRLKNEYWDAVDDFGEDSKWAKELFEEYNDTKNSALRIAFNKYQTNSGEVEARAAQLWDQLSEGEKATTKPSDVYREALGLLDREDYPNNDMPTARIKPKFAEGGVVTGENMEKLFAEGGINTGDAEVDPVSGNEVPPGSMPEEVRDDIDAKLSGGEYVVPADVLRFYGVNFFEKLRKKAKEGLSEMDAEGRIGGDSDEEDEDFPFSEEELMVADEEDDMEFAAGGAVPFSPNSHMFGGQSLPVSSPVPLNANPSGQTTSNPFGNPSTSPGNSSGGMETRTYENTQGQKMQILFINGQPAAPVPTGFFPEGQAPKPTTNKPQAGSKNGLGYDGQESRDRVQKPSGNSSTGRTWDPGIDFSNPDAVRGYVSQELKQANTYGKVGGGLAQLALGPIGGLIGGIGAAGTQVSNARAVSIIARAQGNDALADQLDKDIDDYVESKGLGGKMLMNEIATGELKANLYFQSQGINKTGSGSLSRSNAISAKSTSSPSGFKSIGKSTGSDRDTGPVKDRSSISKGTSAGGKASISIGGSKPSTSKPSSTSSKASSKPAPAKESIEQKMARGGGFNGGGLVARRKK